MKNEPFSGTWKLNIPASTFVFPAPSSVLLTNEVTEDSVIITEYSMSAEGSTENVRIEAKFDNKIYPVMGSSFADGFAIRSISPERWTTQLYQSGIKLFSAILVCSADGKSFREDVELADGTLTKMSLLYERLSKETSDNYEKEDET
jgi:hypothetical protein